MSDSGARDEPAQADFLVPARTGEPDRHARQRTIAGYSQQGVHALRIVVAGAGAVGNEVVKNLVLAGVRAVRVIDFDRVEMHNLSRSLFFSEADVGRSKAACVAEAAARLDPAARIVGEHADLRDALSLAQARQADCLVGCVDNFEARLFLNQLALLAGTPWVDAAIDARRASVTVFPNDRGADAKPCACYECTLPPTVYQRLAERQSCGGLRRLAARDGVVPTTAVVASVAGALAVAEVLRTSGCDTRVPPPLEAERAFLDTLATTSARSRLARNPECPACSQTPRGAAIATTVTSARALETAVAWFAPEAQAVELQAPVVWSCACVHCGPDERLRALVGTRASRHTDALVRCARCGEASVAIEIRDAFAPGELGERLGDAAPQAAWARAGDAIIAIEQHARTRDESADCTAASRPARGGKP